MFSYLSAYLENLSCCLNETRKKKEEINNNIRLKIKKI